MAVARGVGIRALTTRCSAGRSRAGQSSAQGSPPQRSTGERAARIGRQADRRRAARPAPSLPPADRRWVARQCAHRLAPRLDLLRRVEEHLHLLEGAEGHIGCGSGRSGQAWHGIHGGVTLRACGAACANASDAACTTASNPSPPPSLALRKCKRSSCTLHSLLAAAGLALAPTPAPALPQAAGGAPKTKSEAVPMRGLGPIKQ